MSEYLRIPGFPSAVLLPASVTAFCIGVLVVALISGLYGMIL